MTNKKILYPLVASFVIVEAALSYLLQTASGRACALFSILSIFLSCSFAVLFMSATKDYLFTQIGLICTLFADYFLVWSIPQRQLPAMIFFSITQIAYFLRIYSYDDNRIRKTVHIVLRVLLCITITVITFLALGSNVDALSVISMIYYVNLILNFVFASIQFKKHYLFAIGLFLFILCDTCIGLSMLNGYVDISPDSVIYKIINPGFNLAWAFYLPSQVLISLSLLTKKK